MGRHWSADIQNNCRIATGQYTGDGTVAQPIIGIGFRPTYVQIWVRAAQNDLVARAIYQKTDDFIGDVSQEHTTVAGVEHRLRDNRLISLDADGFTVDDDGANAPPNTLAQDYAYLALG